MILHIILVLLMASMALLASLFDNLPAIISDPAHSTPTQNNQHQFLFQPIGKYASVVHYLHMSVPVHFNPILQKHQEHE